MPAERLSRYVQARVTDGQWNWLEYQAVEFFESDLSKALRGCIDQSRIFETILDSDDPRAKFEEFLSNAKSKYDLELVMDAEPSDEA
jgi:hypothetical protein